MFALATLAFSQAQTAENRISQQIVIGGQRVNGAYVTVPTGGIQSFTCLNPQQYVTPDGGSRGWACYDQATGIWLLNALPPAGTQAPAQVPVPVQAAPQQPSVIYQQSAAAGMYGVPYGYGYRPYYYYPGYAYAPRPNMGDVKIDTKIKNDSIYVDGGFAGVTGKLKKFSLTTGNHDIELRDSAGHTVVKERVQVMPRRTVEIKPTS